MKHSISSVISLDQDIAFVRSILPEHYNIRESSSFGSIYCKSRIGIRNGEDEDQEHWNYIYNAIKEYFGKRLSEIFHQTCTYHLSFTIYLKIDNA
jgi:hypothetical protein